ncbi:MAG: preprotein translocase subunit SecG [Candidatus Hydrogenedentes bacterium]|nr:preprotein translocase subunit SecG [Candidatus Hydrogenedentota bacterium]
MLDAIFSWTTLWWLIMFLYVPSCLGLIIVVLLQKGKGVGFAGAFGAGPGSEAVFGPRSARSLPQKITYTMAGLFMFLALIMSMLSGKVGRGTAPELLEASESAPSAAVDALLSGQPIPDAAATPAAAPAETPGEAPAVTVVESPAAPAPDAATPPVEAAIPDAEVVQPAAETPADASTPAQ